MKAVIVAYENGINGPAWEAARSSFDISDYIEGAVGIDASKPANQAQMAKLGISAPSIVIGRYCSKDGQVQIKHLAKMPGIPNAQAIANAAAKVMQGASANNCSAASGPIPTADTGTGNDNQESGIGLNPFGFFSLPFDAPWWLWAAIAGGAAIGSTSANGKIGRYGWGAVAVIAGGNAINVYKNNSSIGAVASFNIDAIKRQISQYRELPFDKIEIVEISTNQRPNVVYFKIKGERMNFTHTFDLTKTGKVAKNSYFRLIDWD